jgi:hypothetical protein
MSSVHMFDPFDRSNGNGSRSAEEDWLDENSTASENQWSTAETTFYYWEASASQQEKFESLYNAHHGKGEGDRRSTIRRSHIVNDAETFVNVLELPRPQAERVVNIAKDLDFSSNRFGGKPYEKILLAVCSLVSDQALSQRLNHQNIDSSLEAQRIVLDETFRDLMEVNDLGSREHNRIREMLREKTDRFNK